MAVSTSVNQMFDTRQAAESIDQINAEIEVEVESRLINEKMLERCWSRVRQLNDDAPAYWLLLVRLAEAALLCAGNYADNCEYEAVGDFLVNPREILVHRPADGSITVKNRHRRLSDQFAMEGVQYHDWMKQFSASTVLEITKQPLLPHWTQILRGSRRISDSYLRRLEESQRRIADTLTFLAAWCICDAAELWLRLQETSAHEREFVESNLCRFDTQIFHQIGISLKRSLADPDFRSPFLAQIRWPDNVRSKKHHPQRRAKLPLQGHTAAGRH
jgi:hypothetical protein